MESKSIADKYMDVFIDRDEWGKLRTFRDVDSNYRLPLVTNLIGLQKLGNCAVKTFVGLGDWSRRPVIHSDFCDTSASMSLEVECNFNYFYPKESDIQPNGSENGYLLPLPEIPHLRMVTVNDGTRMDYLIPTNPSLETRSVSSVYDSRESKKQDQIVSEHDASLLRSMAEHMISSATTIMEKGELVLDKNFPNWRDLPDELNMQLDGSILTGISPVELSYEQRLALHGRNNIKDDATRKYYKDGTDVYYIPTL